MLLDYFALGLLFFVVITLSLTVIRWRAALVLAIALMLAACQSLPGADGRYADSDNGFRATLSVGAPLRSM